MAFKIHLSQWIFMRKWKRGYLLKPLQRRWQQAAWCIVVCRTNNTVIIIVINLNSFLVYEYCIIIRQLHTQYASAQYYESCYSWLVGWVVTRVDCGQMAWRIAFIFGTQVGVLHRNIVLDGHPNRPKNRGASSPKVWVQWEGIGQFQAIVVKFCTATTLGPRNMPDKFQLTRPQNRTVI